MYVVILTLQKMTVGKNNNNNKKYMKTLHIFSRLFSLFKSCGLFTRNCRKIQKLIIFKGFYTPDICLLKK